MNSTPLKFLLTTVILLLLQITILNNIQFSGYVNPYIYVMIIMLLPLEMAPWLILIISFSVGLLVDASAGTPGMHTSATLMAGFVRPWILRYLSPRDGYEQGSHPSMAEYGMRWFATYSVLILLIHHLTLFFMEVFSFHDFFRTLLRVVLSTAFSLIFVMIAEYYRSLTDSRVK
jgi:rod shape-determining protein MreD